MSNKLAIQNRALFNRIKVISNEYRFRIIELTQDEQLNISKISSRLKLSYTKCADYVRLLEKEGLVEKTRVGKEALIKSKLRLEDIKL